MKPVINHFNPLTDTILPPPTQATNLVIYRGDNVPLEIIPISALAFSEDLINALPEYKEGRIQKVRTTDQRGYIYIVTNRTYGDWVKIGSTVSIKQRLNTYQTSDPHRGYKVNFVLPIDDRLAVERWLHHDLGKKFNQKKEWIQCSLVDAIKAVEISLNIIGIGLNDAIKQPVRQ